MRSLLRDVREHKVAAVLLLVGWIALMAADNYLNSLWANSIRTPPVGNDLDNIFEILNIKNLLLLAFLVVAAIVAGWWRATALKSYGWVGPSTLSGLLAALISYVAFDLFEWGFGSIGPLIAAGDWPAHLEPGNGYTWVDAYLIGGLLAGVLGVLGGFFGGWAASVYWSGRDSRRDRKPA